MLNFDELDLNKESMYINLMDKINWLLNFLIY